MTDSPKLKRGLFFGWWIVLCGFGIQSLINGLLYNGYTAYIVPMGAEFGWGKTIFAGANTVQQVGSGVLGPVQGWLLDRFGAQVVIRVGLVVLALGFVLLSQINDVLFFYGAFVLLALGSSMGGNVSISTAVVHWFVRRRALAISIAMAGVGLGGFIVLAVSSLLANFGWRTTALISAAVIILIGLPLTFVFRSRPEDYGMLPDGDQHYQTSSSGRIIDPFVNDFTLNEALHTRAFWCIAFGHSSALLVVAAVNVHLVPQITQVLHVSLEVAASTVTMVTTASLVGQLVGGYLGDRMNKRLLVTFCMLGHMTGLLLLAFATNFAMVVGFAILHGLAWGVRAPLMGAIRADYFGRAAYGRIMGFSSPVIMIGSIIGPLLAGIMYDTSGTYELGFTILAILAGLGSIFFLLSTRPDPPARLSKLGVPGAASAPLG